MFVLHLEETHVFHESHTEMTMDRYGRLFTIDEVSKYFRVSRSTVMNWIYSGRMNSIRISARELRVSESQIVEFIEGCSRADDSASGIILKDDYQDFN